MLDTVDIVALFGPFGRPNRNRKGEVARFEALHTSVNKYSETCLNRSLNNSQNKDLKDKW